MKKTAMTLLACAALGAAYGQDEQQKSGFGLELNAAYNFALRDISKAEEEGDPSFKVNTYGVDLTAVYAFNKNHAVNIRFGYATGDDDYSESVTYGEDFVTGNMKVEVQNIYIMPGYRLTTSMNDSLSFFGGVNVGLAQTRGKVEGSARGGLWGTSFGKTFSESKSKWGFAWSAELGVAQKVSNTGYVTLAVQLQGLYGRPDFGDEEGSAKAESQLNLGVRLGYSCQF